MSRLLPKVILLVFALLCTAASNCYVSGGYVGYGYTANYYDEVFYTPPIDRYGYGFYGHP